MNVNALNANRENIYLNVNAFANVEWLNVNGNFERERVQLIVNTKN